MRSPATPLSGTFFERSLPSDILLMPTALDDFHPAVRAWFERRFDAPSRAQELGWPVIGAANDAPGFDVLLCAPTGSGKTLAAFMWAINRLVLERRATGCATKSRSSTSLRSRRWPTISGSIWRSRSHGVRDVGAESGLDLSRIRAGLRTGDTSASERGCDAAPAAAYSRHDARVAVHPADLAAVPREAAPRCAT